MKKYLLSFMLASVLFLMGTLSAQGADNVDATLVNEETGLAIQVPAVMSKEEIVPNLQALSSNLGEATYARNVEVTITPETLRAAGMEYSDTIWDSTGIVKAWGRFYYNKNNRNQILITKITGNWRSTEPVRYTISGRTVGASCYHDNTNKDQLRSWSPGGSFTYNTGFTRYATPGNYGTSFIGMGMYVKVINRSTGKKADFFANFYPWGY